MFEIKETFYLDGKPFQIISGAIHYYRIVPEYWRDRLEKLRNMGCNTVETYIPWNFHEARRGSFAWDGMRDICRFITIAQDLGLYVILRPSPYICAEWELGGLPAWLLADRNMRLRCSCQPYLDAVRAYCQELIPRLAPFQVTRGGRVILFQIENEYGYYGNDRAYLEFLRDTMVDLGVEIPFVTSDGPWGRAFEAGQVPGVLRTGNFGSHAEDQLKTMAAKMSEPSPLMCMEFWVGWFDAWGNTEHKHSDLEQNKKDLDCLLQKGHLNFYMFHGGTNFGFMNGANYYETFCPDVTSYDYDGVLSEDGQITPKYLAFRDLVAKYRDVPQRPLSTTIIRKDYGTIPRSATLGLFAALDSLAAGITSPYPLSMEEAGQNTGYILYRTRLGETEPLDEIRLEGAADRAQIFANQKHLCTVCDKELGKNNEVKFMEPGAVVDVLVENMGRVNFGTGLEEQRKGIAKGICINGHRHFGYEIFTLPLEPDQVNALAFGSAADTSGPAFHQFVFDAQETGDTFLDFEGFAKGCAFINGFNLGRFWNIGPQKRLYIPGPLLKKGPNTLILFETEGIAGDSLQLCSEPSLG